MELKTGVPFPSIAFLLALILSLPQGGFSQPQNPADPKVPEVNLRSGGPERRLAYSATVELQGMKSLNGKIVFPDDKLIIPLAEEGEKKSFVVRVSNIRSIEFLEWDWRAERKNSFMFYPVRIRINLERSYYISTRNIRDLNKLTFLNASPGDRERVLYSIFYDSREKERWANLKTGVAERPVAKPYRGTVTRIELHMERHDFPGFFNIFKGTLNN